MTRGRRYAALLAAVVLLSSTLTGFAGGAGAQDAGDRPTLRFGVNAADLQFLDPHFASGTQDRTVVDMVFNGLLRYKPGNNAELEPDLAIAIPEPQMEGGQQTWTFQLREGVMCHPGPETDAYALTADDVVYSLQKSANPDSSGYAADYAGMTVEKVDDKTVAITMDPPLSPALFLPKVANYAGGFIVCSQAVEALGLDAFKTNPVGTGPFMFESYTPQTNVMLAANDEYFRGAPQLGGVDVRYLPDASSRELALQSGELDAASGISEAQWVERVNSEGTLKADVLGVPEVAFVNLNVEHEILSNPQVRQVIAYAINREDHQALYGSPVAEIVYSVVPAEAMLGGLTQEQAAEAGVEYAYDPEMARQLLSEAGYPATVGNSIDGRNWELTVGPVPADEVANVIDTYIW